MAAWRRLRRWAGTFKTRLRMPIQDIGPLASRAWGRNHRGGKRVTRASDNGFTKVRVRRLRGAVWAVALGLTVGLVTLVAVLQYQAYERMLGGARRQASGAATSLINTIDQYVDSTLGPLLDLRIDIEGPDRARLQRQLLEVQARHPELGNFVAIDRQGQVMASSHHAVNDWSRELAAPRYPARGAMIGVVVVGPGEPKGPSLRVVADSRVETPAAFGTRIDAFRIEDAMRHTTLSSEASMQAYAVDGTPFAASRSSLGPRWAPPAHRLGDTGTYDTDDALHAWAASARFPYLVRVDMARGALRAEWLRQTQAGVIATLALVLILNIFAALFDRAYRRQARLIDALSRSARHLGDVQRTGHIGLWEADLGAGTIAWSGHVHAITGMPPERSDGRIGTYYKLVHPDDQPAMVEWLARYQEGDGPYEVEHRLCRPDGVEIRVNLRAARIINEEGAPILSGTISEVTAFHETLQRLRESDRDLAASVSAYRQLLGRLPLPLLVVREGRIEFANALANERLGSAGGSIVGRDASSFLEADAVEALHAPAQDGTGVVAWVEPDDGAPFEAELAMSDYQGPDGRGTLLIIRDVTEQRRYEERLNHQATHDELTGLPNRRALREQIDRVLVHCEVEHSGLMVLFIDLDHFKFINDALGHAMGDQVLRELTLKLGDAMDGMGHVGRFGGDEFVAMLPFSGSTDDALAVLPRIQRAIEEPLEVGGTVQHLKCSIGVAFAPTDGHDAETLIRNADTAMYDAKRSGRHTWRRYSADMHATAMARLSVLSRLAPGRLDHELALAWQTQHDGGTGRVVGVEALLRWPSAPNGLASPDRLVPLLEETGAIVTIGNWVLREVCRRQGELLGRLGTHCRVSVNISAQQLAHSDLVHEVRQALADTGADATALELELTESAFMHEPERAIRTLRELRAMGVSIALDDFGTGYSNLTYLSRLPLDRIKIDRHFTQALLHDEVDASICRSIVFLARNLRLDVVAEGVETDHQRQWLLVQGCTSMQGYHFSRPVPLDVLGGAPVAA
jgi:diguanylate cyclase (GGDEF)-like protein/PAS domain S-box-containing protein